MELNQIFENYHSFAESSIQDRFLKHHALLKILNKFSHIYSILPVGTSVEGRSINMVSIGYGSSKLLLWSQMHGNESTGTMALIDLLHFLNANAEIPLIKTLLSSCTLYIIPMLNPDGAERFIRRNAQQIDVNRDFLMAASPEAQILKNLHAKIQPHFAFNLHDQSTLWSVKGNMTPATLSYLAPALDAALSIPESRGIAMQVIADIYAETAQLLPQNIGLFDDEFEPRAFGDNFQRLGTSTILIEAGGLANDPEKQEIRKYYFLSILKGIASIATRSFKNYSIEDYFKIPENGKQLYHIIIQNVHVNGITTNLCINYEELGAKALSQWRVHDIGDCTGFTAYRVLKQDGYLINEYVEVDELANFSLMQNDEIKLVFKNGKLVD